MDYYGALNVTSGSNATEFESKYRRLARKYHPDKLMGLPQGQQKVRLPPTNRGTDFQSRQSPLLKHLEGYQSKLSPSPPRHNSCGCGPVHYVSRRGHHP